MNHIYHSIWNEALDVWIAVSEIAKGQGKRSSNRRKLLATGLLIYIPTVWALPTGDSLIAGQAIVNTPNAGQMQIDQTSQNAIVNWQGFSIAPSEIVNIHQPNTQAALLNRVVGQDASQIQGQLTANGQVYLVNPNGVIFDKTAQVDVGGLIASTHNIKDADFLNGNQHFTQDGATGTIDNQGSIKTPEGGVVALIGTQVSNSGTINTPKGTTALVAGKTVDLDFQGDGLIEVKVTEATLNAQVNNHGAVMADGGRVVLTAKAAGQLMDTVINQDGIMQAKGLVERNGEIILDGGDNGVTQVSGTLNTDGQTGGNIKVVGNQVQINNGATVSASGKANGGAIVIGDKQTTNLTTVQQGASVTAQTLDSGKAGTINILANIDSGTVNVAGQLNASAPKNGDGGFIDTSAAHVNVDDSATISTKAEKGKTGTWLIDPVDFTVAAIGGDITGATLSTNLGSTNVNLDSIAGTTSGVGDVHVNDEVNWSANILTLSANRNININANLNGSGTAQLGLHYGRASPAGGANDNYFINNGAKVTLSAGANFSTIKGFSGTPINYTVITDLGAEIDTTTGTPLYTTLQGIAKTSNLAGNYVLGADIDASLTSGWNSGAGFIPIGTFSGTKFTGQFHGLGHTISSLMINNALAGSDDVGLFGDVNGGILRDVGLINANVAMNGISTIKYAGALVGYLISGSVLNSYTTGGSVNGNNNVGGLVGASAGTINTVYATGSVIGGNGPVGGLIGMNFGGGTISNAYATGSVTGTGFVTSIGGLVGNNSGGTISNAYATGSVTGLGGIKGGLVGYNSGVITSSFWDTQTTLQATAVGFGSATGAIGNTTAQMMQASTFAAWDISSTGGSSAIWRIYEGSNAPLLRSFLTPLSVAANNITKTYNGLSDSTLSYINTTTGAAITPSTNLLGTAIGYGTAKNVGTYAVSTAGLYSNQQGYDISLGTGTLTINPALLTLSTSNVTKVYDGSLSVLGTATVNSGTLFTGDSLSGGTFAYTNKNASLGNKTITTSGVTVNDSNGGLNYLVSYLNNITSTITPALLTLSTSNVTKVYDGSLSALGIATVTNGTLFTGDSLSGGAFAYTNKNASLGNKTITTSGVTVNDSNGGLNYLVSYLNNTTSTINPALLTLSTSDVAKVYDGNLSALGTATVNSGTLFTGDSLSGGTFAYTNKNAGLGNKIVTTNGVTVNDGNSGLNYMVSYLNNTTSTINPAFLTLSTSNVTKVYDGSLSVLGTATVNSGTLFTGDSLSGGTFAYTNKNASLGNKTITTSGVTVNDSNGGLNYLVSYLNNITSTINPAFLTLSTSNVTKVYDGSLSALGTATVTNGTLFTGDSLSGGAFAYTNKNASLGNKTVTTSGVTVNDSNGGLNYLVSYLNNTTSTINPALLTLSANNDHKTYDGTTNSIGTVSRSGLISGDTLSGLTQSFASKNVLGLNGSILNVNSGYILNDGNAGGNYTVTKNTAAGTIIPTALSINAVTDSKVYDSSTSSVGTVAFTGLVGADTVTGATQAFGSKEALGTNGSVLRLVGYTLSDGNNGGNYIVTTNTAAGTIEATPPITTTVTATSPVTAIIEAVPPATELAANIATANLSVIGIITQYGADNATITKVAIVTDPSSDLITMVIIDEGAINKGGVGVTSKNVDSFPAIATLEHNTVEKQTAPASTDLLSITKQDTPSKTQTASSTPHQSNTKTTQSTPSSVTAKSTNSSPTTQKNALASANKVNSQSTATTKTQVTSTSTASDTQQKSVLSVSTIKNSLNNANNGDMVTALKNSLTDAAVSKGASPRQAEQASSLFVKSLVNNIAKGMPVSNATALAQQAFNTVVNVPKATPTQTASASSGTDNQLSQEADAHTASGSAAFKAVLNSSLAKGMSLGQAEQSAQNAAQNADATSSSPQTTTATTLASSNTDANNSLSQLAGTRTASGSATFEAVVGAGLAKGQSPAQAIQTALTAAQTVEAGEKADNSPQGNLANGSMRSSAFTNKSAVFQNTLNVALTKGVPIDQALQRATAAADADQVVIKAEASNVKFMLAADSSTLANTKGDFSNVLGNALKRGESVKQAMEKALEADKQQQQRIKADANNPTLGFSTGKMQLPEKNKNFNLVLRAAIRHGLTPAEALIKANKTLENQPTEPFTPALSFATGNKLDALLPADKHSLIFDDFLNKALSRGDTINEALGFAKRAESIVKGQQ